MSPYEPVKCAAKTWMFLPQHSAAEPTKRKKIKIKKYETKRWKC